MRNIWTIFTRDIRKIRTNVIALIVVLGVTVVPCLYAWYNIAASFHIETEADLFKAEIRWALPGEETMKQEA